MSIYKELDTIITEYVGYDEGNYEEDGRLWCGGDCADDDLHDRLVWECSQHIDGSLAFEELSEDAQWCIEEWESVIKSYSLVQSIDM